MTFLMKWPPFLSVTLKRPRTVVRFFHISAFHRRHRRARGFIDYMTITARGGDGGNGAVMFTSEAMREFCGPDGGNGGNGAHVVIQASSAVSSLSRIPSVITAHAGQPGGSKACAGKSANHIFVDVPVGTLVYEVLESRRKVLADLSKEDDFLVVARGGAGGRGNREFLTNEQRAPAFAEKGGRGEHRRIGLEMKLLADVGLIGMPNAGKSSLLTRISRAHPKIASFPFTTLRPFVGMIELPDANQVSIADLPGIIEGAHKNRGLGLNFLRHTERCRALFYVIDLSSPTLDPVAQLKILLSELQSHNPELVSLESGAVVANKIDLLEENSAPLERVKEFCRFNLPYKVFPISAKYGTNVNELERYIVEMFFKRQKDTLL